MNVLHICSYYSTSPLFKNLFDRQENMAIHPTVYVPIAHEYPKDRISSTGAYTTTVRTHNQNDRYLFHYKHHKILKDLLNRYDFSSFDIIHAHSLFSNGWLAYQLHKKYDIPYIVAVRNTDIETFFKKAKWLWPIGMNILRNAEKIVFISKNSYEEAYDRYIPKRSKEAFLSKTTIIANGIDDYWHENRNEDKIAELHHPIRIVSTAKVMATKRFGFLADALNSYTKQAIEWHIVGPVWEQSVLDHLLTYPFVNYHGKMNKAEMCEIYREMDIFALTSYPETFGLVYVEAMSQGLPVIYTKNEGFDSYFENKTVGVAVERNNVSDVHQALDEIIANYPDYTNQALKNSKQFIWDDVTAKYTTIYNNIINK